MKSRQWRVIVRRDGKLKHVGSSKVRCSEGIASRLKIRLHDSSKECDANSAVDFVDMIAPNNEEFGADAMKEECAGSVDLTEKHEELEASPSSDLDDLGSWEGEKEVIAVFSRGVNSSKLN
jgi:hypothetical protein